jgi:5-methylcytosine-specific restriction endonuclease McrA
MGQCECTRKHEGQANAPHQGERCENKFSQESGWEQNHRVPEEIGGSNLIFNAEILCPACHQLVQAENRARA